MKPFFYDDKKVRRKCVCLLLLGDAVCHVIFTEHVPLISVLLLTTVRTVLAEGRPTFSTMPTSVDCRHFSATDDVTHTCQSRDISVAHLAHYASLVWAPAERQRVRRAHGVHVQEEG